MSIDASHYRSGIAAGFGAFAASSVLLSAIRFLFDTVSLSRPLRVGGTFEIYSWSFYSGHLVGLSGPNSLAFGANNLIYEFVGGLQGQTGGLPPIVYLVVPPLVLLATGYLLVGRSAGLEGRRELFAIVGVMGVSYALLPVVGTVGIRLAFERGLLASPDPGFAILNVAVVYPLLFGGFGGLFAFASGD